MSYRLKTDVSASRFSQLSTHSSCPSDARSEIKETYGPLPVDRHADQDTRRQLIQSLLQHPVLRHLQSDDMQSFVSTLGFYEIGSNGHLYSSGSMSQQLYILHNGTVQLQSDRSKTIVSMPGTIFGREAIYNTQCLESASTVDDTTFWSLSTEALQPLIHRIKEDRIKTNKTAIAKCGLHFYLTSKQVDEMAGELVPCTYENGEKIMIQEEAGNLFYLLVNGEVSVTRNGELVRVMEAGEYFGEQALLYDGYRTATITAISSTVECLSIPQPALFSILGSSLDQLIYRNTLSMAIDASPVLQHLAADAKLRLATAMSVKVYRDMVISSGTVKGEKLWIVVDGKVKTESGCSWGVYDCIGAEEICAVEEGQRQIFTETITSENKDAAVAEIGKSEFEECLGYSSPSLKLGEVRLFKSLSAETNVRLSAELKIATFANGQVLVSENSPSPQVFIVKRGSVALTRSGRLLKTLSKHDHFGERSLFLPTSLWATATATGEVECWYLDAPGLVNEISQTVKYEITQEAQAEQVKLEDLVCVKNLGSGQFGSVFLAVSPKPALYAVKCVSKRRIESGNLYHDVLNERNVLMQLSHPMVVKLHRTFRDEEFVYFMLEHVEGMLFFDVLQQLGQCTEMMTKFYMGCLVLILEHLQERNVIYRDLKPENLMVDTAGFLKLIDFGSAKKVRGRTNTVIGTPQYMAPEIILGKPYNQSVDLWSLGVILFELLCNGVPFGDGQEDTYLVFQQVLSSPLTFPGFVSEDSSACGLISQLLSRDPRDRGTLEDVKNHEFMSGIEYESLMTRECSPPFLPKAKDWTKAIRTSRQNQKSWSTAVSEEGMDEELELPVKRPGVALGPNWDIGF